MLPCCSFFVLFCSLLDLLDSVCAAQARKHQARAEKICAIALQQITQYIASWGDYFFDTHRLPSPSSCLASLSAREGRGEEEEEGEEQQRAIRDKLRGMGREVAAAKEGWSSDAQVLVVQSVGAIFSLIHN
jgi:hypothetical protein